MKTVKILGDTLNKVADTSTVFDFRLWNEGQAQDVTGKAVSFVIANDSGYLFDVPAVIDGNVVSLDFSNEQLKQLTPDTYHMEVSVTNGDGDVEVYPSDGAIDFRVGKNLHSTQGKLVPQITFDTVLRSVDEKIAEYTKTITKGDKGDTGPQGPQGIQGPQGPQGERGKQVFKSSSMYYDQNSSGHWWSDLTPAVSADNPPKNGDTIITSSGDIFQITTVNVGDGGGGGTFGVGGVLGNIKGPKGDKGDTGADGDPNKRGQILDGYDLNGYTDPYKYVINGAKNLVNYPSGASAWATLEVENINDKTATQTLMDSNSQLFVRSRSGSTSTWSAWRNVSDPGDPWQVVATAHFEGSQIKSTSAGSILFYQFGKMVMVDLHQETADLTTNIDTSLNNSISIVVDSGTIPPKQRTEWMAIPTVTNKTGTGADAQFTASNSIRIRAIDGPLGTGNYLRFGNVMYVTA